MANGRFPKADMLVSGKGGTTLTLRTPSAAPSVHSGAAPASAVRELLEVKPVAPIPPAPAVSPGEGAPALAPMVPAPSSSGAKSKGPGSHAHDRAPAR